MENDSIAVLDLLLSGGIGKSKSELRRLIAQGGIAVEGNKLEDTEMCITKEQLANGVKVRKGKKIHRKFVI